MTRKALQTAAIISALLMCVTAAFAHHSFTAVFDIYQPVSMTATIKKVDWVNPHVQIYVETKDETGKVADWKIETWGTGNLHRSGVQKEMLAPGTVVNIRGYKAKDGSNLAYLRNLDIQGGQKFELWIGGTGGSADQQR